MAIIKRKRGNVIYIYEQTYAGIKDGRRQLKEKVIGHLDETGNFIPSKKMRGKKPEDFPAGIQEITTITKKLRVVEKKNEQPEKETVEPEIINNSYVKMRQGTATNQLTKIRSKKENFDFDPITGKGIAVQDGFTVSINNFSEVKGLRPSTHKLITALLMEFTETGGKDTTTTLPLNKYMELRNIDNETAARRQVNEDLETLYSISISFKQKSKYRKIFDYRDMRLVIDKGIEKGIITCTFHPDFYELMKSYQVMPMAKKALGLDDRYNPHAYYFLREFCEHMNMNYFKPNRNLISVTKLLKSAPELPTYEEVMKEDRHYKRKIIEPFERDLDKLNEIEAIKWHYCHTNGTPLSDDEIKNMEWEVFNKALIYFELTDYPIRALPEKTSKKKAPK